MWKICNKNFTIFYRSFINFQNSTVLHYLVVLFYRQKENDPCFIYHKLLNYIIISVRDSKLNNVNPNLPITSNNFVAHKCVLHQFNVLNIFFLHYLFKYYTIFHLRLIFCLILSYFVTFASYFEVIDNDKIMMI